MSENIIKKYFEKIFIKNLKIFQNYFSIENREEKNSKIFLKKILKF